MKTRDLPILSETLKMLHKYNKKLSKNALAELISEPERFKNYSCRMDGLLLDYSRTHLNDEIRCQLLKLAEVCEVPQRRDDLFAGKPVNVSENRPAMHMALRSKELGSELSGDEIERMKEGMDNMLELASILNQGVLPSDKSQMVRNIIHVGIGGSLLGPKLLCDVFQPGSNSGLDVHFLGSVDALPREQLIQALDPRETVVIMVSKSLTTTDTLLHGARIRDWMNGELGSSEADRRIFAVTSQPDKAAALNIPAGQTLYFPSWVGGRYSLWSPVSLVAAAVAGPAQFQELSRGAAEMDRHFQEADLEANLPVMMGLLGVWYRNIRDYPAWGVIPYDQRLRGLPGHLQQLIMESNGKSVTIGGDPVTMATAPVVFGECGTDAQHSVFQAMHQGSDIVPLHLVAVIKPDHEDTDAHAELLANLLAQATSLAVGRTLEQTRSMMKSNDQDLAGESIAHRVFEGNRPSELLFMDDLSARNLGKLLALYEHKVFVESVIWGINPFDQWGVELGKSLAPDIKRALQGEDTATADLEGLLAYIKSRS